MVLSVPVDQVDGNRIIWAAALDLAFLGHCSGNWDGRASARRQDIAFEAGVTHYRHGLDDDILGSFGFAA